MCHVIVCINAEQTDEKFLNHLDEAAIVFASLSRWCHYECKLTIVNAIPVEVAAAETLSRAIGMHDMKQVLSFWLIVASFGRGSSEENVCGCPLVDAWIVSEAKWDWQWLQSFACVWLLRCVSLTDKKWCVLFDVCTRNKRMCRQLSLSKSIC